MTKAKKKADVSEKQKAKRRESKKLSMRLAREKIKENPQLLEEARRKDRERKKEQRKRITEMNSREQRTQRKKWRQYSKKYRENVKRQANVEEMINANTPPPSPDVNVNVHNVNTPPSTSRVESGKKVRRRERRKLRKVLEELTNKNKALKKQVEKYRKRAQRLEKLKETTPSKNTRVILQGRKCPKNIKKTLLFGEVLKNQIKKNFSEVKRVQDKRYIARFFSGKLVKKYRMLSNVMKMASRRTLNNNPLSGNEIKKRVKTRKDIQEFLEHDENSRQCPGKKDTVTRQKNKMQKRTLNDTLKRLHAKFVHDYTDHNELSYSEFCKLRPFWIVSPNCRDRDTCLCKIHSNMSLVVTKLHSLKLISEKSPDEVLKTITCQGNMEERCLERKCMNCSDKEIMFHSCNENDTVQYYQWVDKKMEIEIKGRKKIVKKVIKDEIQTTIKRLVTVFKSMLPKFACHISNIKHQYKSIKLIKKSLRVDEVLIHMDFSENYNCKYSQEVQSMHFGGSRNQVSLHTSVVYYNKEGTIQSVPFCTVSEDRRHNNVAICAHLKPVIEKVKKIVPTLNKIHYVSDGPSTQYRNRKMFVMAATFLSRIADVKTFNWHFMEEGHGKGAPDGVGGCLKRTADGIVARGMDIPSITILVDQLNINCTGINIYHVTEAEIDDIDKIKVFVPTFTGTLRSHEISWSKDKENVIDVRRLSCTVCLAGQHCHHYAIGQMTIQDDDFPTSSKKRRLSVSEVFTDSEEENDQREKQKVQSEEKIMENDYVVVKIEGKKTVHNYVGLIASCESEYDFSVKFMKMVSFNKFIFRK